MIFLVGMPRSGTTWVAKGIDSNPAVHYLHEPDSIQRLDVPILVPADGVEQYQSIVDDYLSAVLNVNDLKVQGRLPFFPKDHFSGLQLQINRASVYAIKALSRLMPCMTDRPPPLFKPYGDFVVFIKSIESSGRVKLLANSAHCSKIVLLARHPCAVINSEIRGEQKNLFSSNTPIYENWGLFEKLLQSSSALEAGLSLDRLRAMSIAERLAWKWRIFYESMLEDSKLEKCSLVYYERICLAPNEEFRQIFKFLGLEFTNATAHYLNNSTSSHSESYYSVSKNPKTAMSSWKTQMSEKDIAQVLSVTQHLLTEECWQL